MEEKIGEREKDMYRHLPSTPPRIPYTHVTELDACNTCIQNNRTAKLKFLNFVLKNGETAAIIKLAILPKSRTVTFFFMN